METQKRPLETGTANQRNTPNPAPQVSGQRPSRGTENIQNRKVLRRPADAHQPGKPQPPKAAAPTISRRPIRQVSEEQGNGFTLGSLPRVSESKTRRRKNDFIPTKKSRIREPMPLATIVFSILCTVLVMFMMINFVKINEYTHDIADMQNQLTKMERQEQELMVELEKKNDLTGVDLEALGLVKEDSLKTVEIITDKDETAEYFEVSEEDTGVIATVMNALSRNYREYWNIFFGKE